MEPASAVPPAADDVPSGPPPTPLLVPRDGALTPLTDPIDLQRLATRMTTSGDTGPVALDAERASGFRYSARAYLVQMRRADVGSVLIDPIPLRDLEPLQPALLGSEWVLHAASQDLPCLAEIGLRPRTLFDTELAGRIAGLPKVGLGPLVEQMLGLGLEKGHGAADWSVRPLPEAWLNYAALDVEVLLELREAMIEELDQQGKLDWAREEFAALVAAPPPAPRVDPWRRTSGIHKIRDRRALAVIRALWQARDAYASQRDIAPHRVLPDAAIVAAAVAAPSSVAALVQLPLFGGRGQRRQADRWMAAIAAAQRLARIGAAAGQDAARGPAAGRPVEGQEPRRRRTAGRGPEALTALGERGEGAAGEHVLAGAGPPGLLGRCRLAARDRADPHRRRCPSMADRARRRAVGRGRRPLTVPRGLPRRGELGRRERPVAGARPRSGRMRCRFPSTRATCRKR